MSKASLAVISIALVACVESPDLGTRQQVVIDGEVTPEGLFPATGALLMGIEVGCTGTLITPRVVLTAAHCVDRTFIGDVTPSFTLDLDANSASTVVAGLSHHQHPAFNISRDFPDGLGKWDDIGIVILTDDVPDAEIAILPTPEEAANLQVGVALDIVGYGVTSTTGPSAGVKHHGSGDLRQLGSHELLISEPGQQQNCSGDSGGPALVDLGDGPRIVGVVSRSPDDDPTCDHGGIDTRVDPYLTWIHTLVDVECGGLAGPCEMEGGGCCSASDEPPVGSAILALVVGLALRRRWPRGDASV